jgi:tetratricopeptide (TPR) repeat protein/SAM-dependent methyltransferase
MEFTLDQALHEGIEAHKAGKVQDADRYYTAILKVNPDHPDANHNMGILGVDVGKVEEALPFFKAALEANSNIVQYWLSYIDAFIKLDRMADAKEVYDQAKSNGAYGDAFDQLEKRLGGIGKDTELNPNSEMQEAPGDQFQSIANLYSQGQYQEALNEATKLLEQFPNSVNLYNIMGATNKGLGKLDEALEAYTKALSFKPDYAAAYYNIAITLQEQGKIEEAIEAYRKTLSVNPDFGEAYYHLGLALKGITLNKQNRNLHKTIVSLLDKKRYTRPIDIAKAAISLLKLEPTLQKHLQLVDTDVTESPLGVISDLSELPLLLKLMSVCPLPDLELERLLTKLRCSILSNISSLKEASSQLIGFQSALALQCYTNEYIYDHTEEEEIILQSLEASIKKSFKNNEQPSPQIIFALASYKAINEYDWCNLLVITDDIKDVFDRQIEEPNQEEKLKQDLPILDDITDQVSAKVRAQYEESPYPRWVNLGLALKPVPILKVVNEINLGLYNRKITDVETPEILIAGCGTGQHSIGTAKQFKSSKVLAVDLSLSSLAYAKRKTDEFGIGNIDYMQADILDLAKLNKQFDIIESVGVLHHMDNPMAGWKVLSDCLKPGGLMNIGLYSELARQNILKIRQEIGKLGIGSSNAEIKSFRDMITGSDKDHYKQVLRFPDFYSLSELKDLLFHIQEHRFTIPLIKDYLDKLGLKFCGFETKQIVSHFTQTNKARDDPYDLDKWQAYEEANPTAFTGMYQFWCQKDD